MIAEKMKAFVKNSSAIRAMLRKEKGRRLCTAPKMSSTSA